MALISSILKPSHPIGNGVILFTDKTAGQRRPDHTERQGDEFTYPVQCSVLQGPKEKVGRTMTGAGQGWGKGARRLGLQRTLPCANGYKLVPTLDIVPTC